MSKQTSENLDGNVGADKPPLITPEERETLKRNGRSAQDLDPVPVVKLHDPACRASWLLTEISPHDADVVYGLIDLSAGYPRPGQFRLSEQEAGDHPQFQVKRDPFFEPRYPLSVYAEAARIHGATTENEEILEKVAERLGYEPPSDS